MTKLGCDLELTTYLRELNKNAETINRLVRDEMEGSLFLALMLIEQAAKKGQERLNKLRWNPLREPMGG